MIAALRQGLRALLNNTLERWHHLVQRHKIAVVVLSVITASVAAIYAQQNIRINTDTEDMLSAKLEWRQLDRQLATEFPQFAGGIVIVIEAPTPDQAVDAANALSQKLQQETAMFTSVFSLRALPFMQRAALLYLDPETLQKTADDLAKIQPLLAILVGDPTLRGLFALIETALKTRQDDANDALTPLIAAINSSLAATLDGRPKYLSWQKLFSGGTGDQSLHREFIIAQARLDYAKLFPAESALQTIRTFADTLGINAEHNLRLRLTGTTTLAHEELSSVMKGTEFAIVLALVMITVIMLVGLGSLWFVAATLITLVTGLLITAAWATLTVGELNLISVAFTVLYIGLGVDFAIHYCLRFREYRREHDATGALSQTSRHCGSALLLCTVTTAIGFFAFIPTDYKGIAELGWISGCGMFISFAMTMTLLPALLGLIPSRRPPQRTIAPTAHRLLAFPVTHAKLIVISAAIMLIPVLWLIPKLAFDPNTLNLQNPDNESVKTYLDLLRDSKTSPLTAEIVVDTSTAAAAVENTLKTLPVVDEVIWVDKLIPSAQKEKLAIIEDIDLLLTGIDFHRPQPSLTPQGRLAAVRRLADFLDTIDDDEIDDLRTDLRTVLSRYAESDPAAGVALLATLEKQLLGTLPGRLHALQASLAAEPFEQADLPSSLGRRWVSDNQRYLVRILPSENLADNESLERFVATLQAEFPQVTGAPVVSIEAGKAVVAAFQQALATAITAIMVILLVLFDSRKAPWLIMLPLAFALLLTAAGAVLIGIPLNFANIIALPLLLGIGVDSGIHILHRYQTEPPKDGIILATGSARAVLVSALTTIVSIGNLAFSPHLGTASMGQLLTLGITMTLICTLIILPGLLVLAEKHSHS